MLALFLFALSGRLGVSLFLSFLNLCVGIVLASYFALLFPIAPLLSCSAKSFYPKGKRGPFVVTVVY